MAIFTHTDYKIVCDNCCADITDYFPAKNKTHAVRIARVSTGKELKRGRQFCEDCENEEGRPPKYTSPPLDAFEGTRLANIDDLRKLGLLKSINQ